jgi:hypothetical protein
MRLLILFILLINTLVLFLIIKSDIICGYEMTLRRGFLHVNLAMSSCWLAIKLGMGFGEFRHMQKSNILFGSASTKHSLSTMFKEGVISQLVLYVVVAS